MFAHSFSVGAVIGMFCPPRRKRTNQFPDGCFLGFGTTILFSSPKYIFKSGAKNVLFRNYNEYNKIINAKGNGYMSDKETLINYVRDYPEFCDILFELLEQLKGRTLQSPTVGE